MKQKFIKKYMRLARAVGQDNDACYSRSIGVIIVDPCHNKIVSTGYNGVPTDIPHMDNRQTLIEFFLPQLSDEDIEKIRQGMCLSDNISINDVKHQFIKEATGCKTCPRRFVGAGSGERNELCACAHAERNAIERAGTNLQHCYIFCDCGIPCLDCTYAIIQSGIKRVYCLDSYNKAGNADAWRAKRQLWLFEKANIIVNCMKEEEIYGKV